MSRRQFRRFACDRRGSVSIELALVFPIMLALLGGAVETINYVLLHQKVERAATTVADLVSQSRRVTEGMMDSVFVAAGSVMQPYTLTTEGSVIVSSITASSSHPAFISWQRTDGGYGGGSAYGHEGEDATLPAGLTLNEGDNIIVCEVWFLYEPVLMTRLLPVTTIYRSAVFRPRFSTLEVIHP